MWKFIRRGNYQIKSGIVIIVGYLLHQGFSELPPTYANAIHVKDENHTTTVLHGDEAPSAGWTPSGCCSQREFGHPLAAFQRRSIVAGLVGCPPCPESWS